MFKGLESSVHNEEFVTFKIYPISMSSYSHWEKLDCEMKVDGI